MDMPSYLMGKRAGGGTVIETDPIFSNSAASGITSSDIANWNDKPDLTDYVKNTDYATSSKGGVVKTDSGIGIDIRNDGRLQSRTYDYNTYSGGSNNLFISKGTLENVIAGKGLQIQLSTMPTASADNLGKIVQFIGTTDSTYTNGYFYKCVSDGASTPTYSWEEVEVQAGGGGGASYTAGTNIEITNNNVINNTIPYQYGGTSNQSMAINPGGTLSSYSNTLALGYRAAVDTNSGVALGRMAMVLQRHYGSIALGTGARTTKQKQCVIGGLPDYGYEGINELAIATTNGLKVMATEDYVDNLVGNINTVLATLTTPSNGGGE